MSLLDPLQRDRQPELMDHSTVDPHALATSLRDLEGVNRWLGGKRTAIRLVQDIVERVKERPVLVLDVATGGADIPVALVAAARRSGVRMRVTATDIHPKTLDQARKATRGMDEIRVARADAVDLPYMDRAFHIVMCHTTLHHFSDVDAVRALREMARVAKSAVIVTDFVRSRAALFGAKALAWTVWRRHPVTRHDGPISVRGSFTRAELETYGKEVFGPAVIVRKHPIFRMSLVADYTMGSGGTSALS
jgi:SAM-dependent methyltransferase